MTDNQINYLNMTNINTAFLDESTTILSTITKVTTLITAIKATLASIGRTATTQSLNITDATLTKKQLKTIAEDKAEDVASDLQYFNEDLGDMTFVIASTFAYLKNPFYLSH